MAAHAGGPAVVARLRAILRMRGGTDCGTLGADAMKTPRRFLAAAIAIAATALAVHASQTRIQPRTIPQAEPGAAEPRPSVPTPRPGAPVPIPGPIRPPPQPGVPPPHPDDVGDVHSFGRSLTWLGV